MQSINNLSCLSLVMHPYSRPEFLISYSAILLCVFLCAPKTFLQQKEYGLVAQWSLLRYSKSVCYLK